jgi:hypothetical protein
MTDEISHSQQEAKPTTTTLPNHWHDWTCDGCGAKGSSHRDSDDVGERPHDGCENGGTWRLSNTTTKIADGQVVPRRGGDPVDYDEWIAWKLRTDDGGTTHWADCFTAHPACAVLAERARIERELTDLGCDLLHDEDAECCWCAMRPSVLAAIRGGEDA